ncbi:hypothetical protein VP01_1541g4 [Puccinia sorghi]|uniref:Uncharacterized protein n=1 Tax=Puccinia sorghi TaxID=27349 RepID=A0A0L6VIY6_9BASI|nr:hypothetical protein VP01_1541g4 [Puccinia sorghi]
MVSHPQPGPSNSRASQASTQLPASEPPQTLKLLLIGSSSVQSTLLSTLLSFLDIEVGKSSLLLRFTDQVFLSAEESSATIGVDFKFKLIDHKGKRYKLSIWDTAGQVNQDSIFRSGCPGWWILDRIDKDELTDDKLWTLTSSYYRGAQGVLLGLCVLLCLRTCVYDVTNRASFESLPSWFSELDTFAHSPQDVVRVIVGNKVDKDESRTVSTEEGRAFASDNHAMFFETSVKTRKGVDEVFEAVVDKVPLPSHHISTPAAPIYYDDDQAGSWCNC